MRQQIRNTMIVVAAVAALAMLAWPLAAMAQSSVRPAQQGTVVQKTTTVDAQGNTVVTERTFRNGILVKEEVRVRNRQGRLISRVETVFDPSTRQIIRRETVTVADGRLTRVEERFNNGQLVRREERVVRAENEKQENEIQNEIENEIENEVENEGHDNHGGDNHGGDDHGGHGGH